MAAYKLVKLIANCQLDGKIRVISQCRLFGAVASMTAANNNRWFGYLFLQKINFELLRALLHTGVLRNLIIQYICKLIFTTVERWFHVDFNGTDLREKLK